MTGRYSRFDRDNAVELVLELMASGARTVDDACEAVHRETGVPTPVLRRWAEHPDPPGAWLANRQHGSADSWKALADRILSGEPPESIARGTGGAASSVYSYLRRAGVCLGDYLACLVDELLDESATNEGGHDPDLWSATSRARAARVPITLRSQITVAQAVGIEAGYRSGAGIGQLARQWRIAPKRVLRVLHKLGVNTQSRRNTRDEQILELRASGMSIRKIADKVGVSSQTVWRTVSANHTDHTTPEP